MSATGKPAAEAHAAPLSVQLHRTSRRMEIRYDDGARYDLPFELLRVYSPSAEVQGHGQGQSVLQVGKQDIDIEALDTVGHYAVKPRFSDGHDSGIYTWDYLHFLGSRQSELWNDYLDRLQKAGASRTVTTATTATTATRP